MSFTHHVLDNGYLCSFKFLSVNVNVSERKWSQWTSWFCSCGEGAQTADSLKVNSQATLTLQFYKTAVNAKLILKSWRASLNLTRACRLEFLYPNIIIALACPVLYYGIICYRLLSFNHFLPFSSPQSNSTFPVACENKLCHNHRQSWDERTL